MVTELNKIDWSACRDSVDLVAVVTRYLGPAPGRRGGGRLWWNCPFHEDDNPSLQVKGSRWTCFGCGAKGDAVDFVLRLNPLLTFPDATRLLVGGSPPKARPKVAPKAPELEKPPEDWPFEALDVIDDAQARLWEEEGVNALDYLKSRGLTEATIRAARLGLSDGRRRGVIPGITIPWLDHGTPRMIQVRRPDGSQPRYMATKGSRRGGVYPDPKVIQAGHPMVIVEGELDALLLGQELGGLAAVVTLGSASERPKPAVLGSMLGAFPWYVATDADEAGDSAATGWPSHARRVRPPACHKDWTEAKQAGVNLRRWWDDVLAGNPTPSLFTWDELSTWRWGPAMSNLSPGLVID